MYYHKFSDGTFVCEKCGKSTTNLRILIMVNSRYRLGSKDITDDDIDRLEPCLYSDEEAMIKDIIE